MLSGCVLFGRQYVYGPTFASSNAKLKNGDQVDKYKKPVNAAE